MTPPLITEDGGQSVDIDEGPGMLLSAGFWLGGLLALAIWSGIWVGIAALLDSIKP